MDELHGKLFMGSNIDVEVEYSDRRTRKDYHGTYDGAEVVQFAMT